MKLMCSVLKVKVFPLRPVVWTVLDKGYASLLLRHAIKRPAKYEKRRREEEF